MTADMPAVSNPAPCSNSSKQLKRIPLKAQGIQVDPQFTSSELARLKSLYLVKGAGPSEIAKKLNRNVKTVSQWIFRLKLVDKRKELAKRIEAKELANATNDVERALESWKNQSEEVTEDIFDLTRQEIVGESPFKAKNVAAYSQAIKNFTQVYRDSAGVSASASGPSIGVANFYVQSVPSVPSVPSPKNADNVVDI